MSEDDASTQRRGETKVATRGAADLFLGIGLPIRSIPLEWG